MSNSKHTERIDASPNFPAPAADEPFDKTCEEVLEEAILELVELGYKNGMTPDDVDYVLDKIMNERAEARRASFKMHGAEDEP